MLFYHESTYNIVHLLSMSQNSPQMNVLRTYLIIIVVFLFVVYLEKCWNITLK